MARGARVVASAVAIAALGGVGLASWAAGGVSSASRAADGGPGRGGPPPGVPGRGPSAEGIGQRPGTATLVLTPAASGSGSTASTAVTLDLTGYDFSSSVQGAIGSQSSGAGAGKVVVAPLVVTTVPGPQTAGLFADLAAGGAFTSAELVVAGQPAGSPLLDVTFKLVQLQKIEESSSAGAAETPGPADPVGPSSPVETLSFSYGSSSVAPPPSGGQLPGSGGSGGSGS